MSGRYIPVKIRAEVIQRANERCEYCQSWMKNAIHTFNIDHIIPLDKGGKSNIENLALSCGGCNSAKSDKVTAIDSLTNTDVRNLVVRFIADTLRNLANTGSMH